MPTIYRYQPYAVVGPDGTVVRHTDPEGVLIQLAELDGYVYVSLPDGASLPEQPNEITFEEVTLDDALRERLKRESRHVLNSKALTRRAVEAEVGDLGDQVADLERRLGMAERLL